MGGPFSRRYGYRGPREITVREDAPEALRIGLLQILHDRLDLSYTQVRQFTCHALRTFPDLNNWSDIPNVRDEVIDILRRCDWYRVYDVIEAAYQYLIGRMEHGLAGEYEAGINALFQEEGIGWQMIDGEIVTRGPAELEHTVNQAVTAVGEAGYQTVKRELEEARQDLSRRPEPDVTGATQHCMAALECLARTLVDDSNSTLGQIVIHRATDLGIPRPLDRTIATAWGYASQMGRHLQEGRVPSREEAELLLGLSASMIVYLLQKNPP